MKTTKKILLIALLAELCTSIAVAQEYSWKKPPQSNEKEVGIIIDTVWGGRTDYFTKCPDKCTSNLIYYTDEQSYEKILEKAKKKFGSNYPDFAIRNFKSTRNQAHRFDFTNSGGDCGTYDLKCYEYLTSATIVIEKESKTEGTNEILSNTINKALQDVREGSRIAIDQIKVTKGIDKEEYKDQIVEILLDNGFKIVAKEYLDKIYEEQQNQQSGIYNDRTTVKENNISAVGYYLNIRLTETALRVQVIDVSSGEYVGNVTVRLQEK